MMSEKMKTKTFVLSRIILGLVFLVSGYLKALDIQDFVLTLYKIEYFSYDFSLTLSIIIIGFELTLGLLLIFGLYLNITLKIIIILLSLFTVFLISVLLFKLEIGCHCFGKLSNRNITYLDVLRNIILMLASILLFRFNRILKYNLSDNNIIHKIRLINNDK
jgi:uncharacterized membrane protein YphA (DoxX/SURF4 family)